MEAMPQKEINQAIIPGHTRREEIWHVLYSIPPFSHLGRQWSIDYQDPEGQESQEIQVQEIAALHGAVIKSDDPSDAESGPDVIQAMPGSDGRGYLAEVQFFAEGKGKGTVGNREEQLSNGLLQAACYARATLIHQIERLHAFSVVAYGTEAIFIRLGRTGILHSLPFNLEGNFPALKVRFLNGIR
ncbi:hypothetical protein RhiXN_10379 [Rhizoctonia solani]|uniref:Uncharacterized protein n=1 Tax=Rhizoctonia solani TaxID=456999 RepID=A0A8H8P2K3_9AGAM|nr:uncharacterized protein RhiXN_10379 [Rhizoctonia solani]QRW24055.1 hypothetical protein RhiXN_10379 [Rhizoctonia solani]